ncbi:TolC family protein [Kalamiella sp. sgz302252]|uniref:TolC family protein n=1 Tax=Pantoea sp. sgz302252 TaxID=3341827 RepID=UPI0036D3563A
MADNHPAILSAENSASAALSDIDQAKAANSLKVSAGVSAVGYAGQSSGYENTLFSPHVSASKILYDHGRADAAINGREAAYYMQQAQTIATRESVQKQILTWYVTALSDAKMGAVMDEQIKALTDLRDRIKKIAAIDPGRAFEINQVEARLNSALVSKETRDISGQQAWKQLSQLLQENVSLTHELPDLKKAGLFPASLEQAEQLLKEHPSLAASKFKRDEAEATARQAAKWNRPQWKVQLSMDSPRRNGDIELFKTTTLQFSTDIDLFDGGSGAANEKSQALRLSAADAELEATKRSLTQELRQLWVSLPLREKQLATLETQTAVAKKTLEAGEEQFLAGRRPLTDLISFISDYYASMASYEDNQVQYVATQWKIMSALGRISKLIKDRPTLSAPVLNKNLGQYEINKRALNNIRRPAPVNNSAGKNPFKESQTAITKPATEPGENMLTVENNNLRAWPWK